ncbi:MAG: RNA methyltransferase [Deltaproteobacteria bacterium]|nr:RNA methyltransferase [Deltaproteobacteria bacterium]
MKNDLPSASQNQLKRWARLSDAKFRRDDGSFLAEGIKVVEELLKSAWPIEALLVLPEKNRYWEELVGPVKDRHPVYPLTRSQWKKLSQDKEPEGLIAIVKNKKPPSFPEWLKSAEGHVLIGYQISNPQNLGALMRSAYWFGFGDLLLGGGSVDWQHPKVIRASMGALFHLRILADVDIAAALPAIRKNYVVIGSDVRQGLAPHPLAPRGALLVGSESHGLPADLLEQSSERWRISGNGRSDSLSLPQAAAIMMYEMTKKE